MVSYYLVQISTRGFDNIISNLVYKNEEWRKNKRNSDQGKILNGDYLIVYFTGKVPYLKCQILNIYLVTSVNDDHRSIYLKLYRQIEPITLLNIKKLINDGQLSNVFINCGHQGFNITKTSLSDYSFINSRKEIEFKLSDIVLGKDHIENLEKISNYNILFLYQNNLNEVPKSIKYKLLRLNYIYKHKNKICLTNTGKHLLNNHLD